MIDRRVTVIAAIASAVALAGCSAPEAAPEAEPIFLTIGTDDSPGVPAADQIAEFADQVKRLSDGKIVIEPSWHAAGSVRDWDQAVAQMVIDGELDMGLIPSRAWDMLGVDSLQPLTAPFLITSTTLTNEVVRSDIADRMLAGLNSAGVTGLALVPEGLRRPFAFHDAMLGPASYSGGVIRIATSDISRRMYAALGASTNDEENDPAVHSARESSFLLGQGGSTATGNVVFYPKVNVFVIGEAAADSVGSDGMAVLTEAAKATRDWSIESAPAEADLATEYCDSGGTIVTASAEDVDGLMAATSGVVAEIAAKPGNADTIEAIREMSGTSAAVEAVPACAPVITGTENALLNGTYRWEMTEAEFRDNGVEDPAFIRENLGVYTWVFSDGTWNYTTVQTVDPADENFTESGTYVFDGERLVLTFSEGPETYGVTIGTNGDLALTPIAVPEHKYAVWASANTWERIE